MTGKTVSLPRAAALVGPFSSGKTSLLEALLFRAEAIPRQGRIKDGNTVGDASVEARARLMSVEPNLAGVEYLGERWTFIDCPGSVEFQQDTYNVLMAVDAAIVVCEPDPARAVMVAPLLKFLDEHGVPHLLFINKIDSNGTRLRETLEALQGVSDRPLVLREVPIREGEQVTGFIDLVSERAYKYRPGQKSDLIKIPDAIKDEEQLARQEMLEHLADFDDHLMEELLEDITPPQQELYDDLARDLADDLIVPVFFGSAENDGGITRLWKALRHDVPAPTATAARLGFTNGGAATARVFKTVHAAHTGKLSWARVLRGEFADAQALAGGKVSGLYLPAVGTAAKMTKAGLGDVVGFGRLDNAQTGDVLGGDDQGGTLWPKPLEPLFALALEAEKKGDDVKLSGALTKLAEEDPSYRLEQNAEFGETVLWGQGEIHLLVALERLKSRFGLGVVTHKPTVPYKETIKKPVSVHGRHKKQSGGHGQFGDVHVDIRPQPRGAGFVFEDKIVGGAVPRQYIPAVEDGVVDFLKQGALGFPVVDIAVTLTDGSYHAVDSSDMAFKTAARIAMAEGMPQCDPVLLEPILAVEISVPTDFTSKAQRIITGRRGQILGFDAKEGWAGWDQVSAYLPQAEMGDLIVELRSLTMGVGTFGWRFDHLQELSGRAATQVVDARKESLAKKG
ncbi:elongation factor G [Magnetospirillum gryphiswaldense]|uniref:Elongation factor G n=1 Tax=Magnetospirillum gryphiswaldense TaxID=55518 RepID=A4TVZ0_9PROT|nr:elongation factor G [Magnetospirillum gryphiswaldense]AVM74842.1 Elongation factor G [Magnetospirillum gryphiswaldense MSR-1]AVM78745.1 Elongation factor G [Magnetospirillum gryphiswaldense]CAM74797.1 Translation elongation factor G:Small GTP-binding protein domain [Magnetospirillum gryphiswaldense MSR-1]